MIEHSADKYEAVKEYPILKGYLEHFRQVSKDNEIPGLLSFFFIQWISAELRRSADIHRRVKY